MFGMGTGVSLALWAPMNGNSNVFESAQRRPYCYGAFQASKVLPLRQTGANAPITSQLLVSKGNPLTPRTKLPDAQCNFLRRTGHELYGNTTHDGPDSKIVLSAGTLLQSSKMPVLFWS